MNLKASKTHDNLKAAFAGESQANRRYLYFATKADVEGQNDIAAVFRSTAEGETGHAHGHLDYLATIGDPICRSARAARTSSRPSPARRTSTRTCTRAWPRPRAAKASRRSPTGSKRWPRRSGRTRTGSRRLWTGLRTKGCYCITAKERLTLTMRLRAVMQ